VIKQLFASTATELTHQEPLGAYLNPYADVLAQRGYARHSIRNHIVVIADFNRWLHRRHIELRSLNSKAVDQFVQHHQRRTGICRGDRGILNKFLAMLGHTRVVDCQDFNQRLTAPSPRQDIADEFRRYLLEERGLSEATLRYYISFIEQFLSERFRNQALNLSALRAADVIGFVRHHVHQLSSGRAKLLVTALRSFCRFLRGRGEIALNLADCVPTVPNWSKATLPKFLPPGTVQRVLSHCDHKTPLGRRDYAILLLLARLGLRAGEVLALKLEDIDWEAGQMTVHGKGGRSAQMPLPADVGEAIAAYLQRGRPQCSSRRIFIRAKAPLGGFASSAAICCIVMQALERAGVESPRKGAHLFRHTLACDLLRQGCSLDEIGELLRHQSPNTTEIYAKVDLTALRSVAQPWPGGSR
jgi:site-specific recombinase XerD